MSDPFYGPKLKVSRANHHINELETLFAAYRSDHPDGISRKIDPQPGYEIQKIGGKFSEHTPTVMGDAIHNLRASLDHAFGILVTANKHNVDRHTAFPFRDNEIDLKGTFKGIRGKGAAPSKEVEALIVYDIKPYKGTKLYGLHDLDIADKHRTLLPSLSTITATTMRVGTGVIENCYFGSVANHNPNAFGGAALAVVGPPGSSHTQIHGDFSGDIAFPYGTPFAGQSIIPVLKELSNLVAGLLEALEEHAR